MFFLRLPLLACSVNGSAITASELADEISEKVILPIDKGWTQFRFKGPGTGVDYHFPKGDLGDLLVTVTDAFFAGDSFDIFLDDELVASSPSIPADETQYSVDPEFTQHQPQWSSIKFYLPTRKTSKRLSIRVRESPLGGGRGFVSVDVLLKQCPIASDLLLISTPLVTMDEAFEVCESLDARLLVVNDENRGEAKKMMRACGVRGKPAWADMGKDCHALGYDGRSIKISCKKKLKALCKPNRQE